MCGAKVTEPLYLRGLLRAVDNRAVDVRVKVCPRDPVSVIRYAVRLRDQAGEHYTHVWCVLDVDDFDHLEETLQVARDEGIEVALSHPCFELWLLLHFRDHHAAITGYQQAARLLVPHHPGYSKTADKFDFSPYRDTWPSAVKRAKALAKAGEEHKTNPSTGMWRLVSQIVPDHLRA
ncbi:RloB family protein [Streptomyces sp. NPDC048290]|uniref:RloB family protein n=1 Tax=Streptomyces sp. NPDC048290 TaxID=3155811 RepID=UPI00343C69E9